MLWNIYIFVLLNWNQRVTNLASTVKFSELTNSILLCDVTFRTQLIVTLEPTVRFACPDEDMVAGYHPKIFNNTQHQIGKNTKQYKVIQKQKGV